MNKRVQWRAVMLVTMATVAFGLSVRSYAATTPPTAAGPTIERYNPYIDGNRMVFTQVTRQPDDTTTAAIWSRDLATGRESLVADVGTGEPMPVANRSWTAWSEMASDTHSVVRARSTRGGAVIDVFTTAASPFPGFGDSSPDRFLPSVALTDDRLVTTNGTFVDLAQPELVRFDLPSTRPAYVDVLTTTEGLAKTWVSAAKGATVMSDLGPPQLFFVLDNGGKLVSSPFENCSAGFTEDQSQAVIDGRRVAIGLMCNDAPAIATCLLPCTKVDIVRLVPFSIFGAPRIALSGDVVAFNRPSPFFGGQNAVMVMDLTKDTEPTAIHTTDGAIGPRVSIAGNRIAWDETSFVNGRRHADLYVYDRATKRTVVIDGTGNASPLAAAAPVRLSPDVESGQVAYNELNVDGTESGIWIRSLTGRSQLVSAAATDDSFPMIGDRYVAWNRRIDESGAQQVVAARRDGRGPAIDVFTTSETAPPNDLGRTLTLDMDGDRAVISTFTTDEAVSGSSHVAVLTGEVGTGRFTTLTPTALGAANPVHEMRARGDNGTTVALGAVSVDPPVLVLYDRQGNRSTGALPPFCSPFGVDIDGPSVIVAGHCFVDAGLQLWSCQLPCGPPTSTAIASPDGVVSQSPVDMDQANGRVVVRLTGFIGGGRYHRNRGLQVSVMQLVDLAQPASTRVISIESGRTSPVRMDGDLAVWSVDRYHGVRTGTVFVYDARKGTTTAL